MATFEKGDRVNSLLPVGGEKVVGAVGTVIDVEEDHLGVLICVEYDEDIEGHDNNRTGKDGHCWCSLPYKLEKINRE